MIWSDHTFLWQHSTLKYAYLLALQSPVLPRINNSGTKALPHPSRKVAENEGCIVSSPAAAS